MSEVTFGKYQIGRELGRGAMGVVYEAVDPSRGVEVALKVMTPAPGAGRARQVARFLQEARTLAELNHFHVVRVFDEGEVGGRYFLAMELIRGTNLRDRLQFQGPLSFSELQRLALEQCSALEHIHSRGVIHRDIKPDNIMLLPDGRSKLMDFGIARLALDEGLNRPGSSEFQGSPAYMSPEQTPGDRVDCRSDIYSLAITVYEAATGKRAFEGDSVPVIVNRVVQEYPPPPAGLPPYFQGVLMRAMAKDPRHRYANAVDMAADLTAGRIPTVAFSPIHPGAGGWAAAPPAAAPSVLPGYCPAHPLVRAAETCSACGRPICYTCYLQVPERGIICRNCAFGR